EAAETRIGLERRAADLGKNLTFAFGGQTIDLSIDGEENVTWTVPAGADGILLDPVKDGVAKIKVPELARLLASGKAFPFQYQIGDSKRTITIAPKVDEFNAATLAALTTAGKSTSGSSSGSSTSGS